MNDKITLPFNGVDHEVKITLALIRPFETKINWKKIREGESDPPISDFAEAYSDALNIAGVKTNGLEVRAAMVDDPEFMFTVIQLSKNAVEGFREATPEVISKTKKPKAKRRAATTRRKASS